MALTDTLEVVCVRTGTKYGPEYVERLERMVARHLSMPYRFRVLGDDDADGLTGWWAKMRLFDIAWSQNRQLFFDLDTVLVDSIDPLAQFPGWGICRNFTREVSPKWPCRYGSCVMTIPPGFGKPIWEAFNADREGWMAKAGRYGDQWVIEQLAPQASYLQDVTPEGFFVGRRAFTDTQPEGAAVMVFAGEHKPHNTPHKWLREAWA